MNTNDMMFIIFLVMFAVIILEWRMKCPLGATMVVLCLIPPEWRFMFLKKTEET